MAKRLQLLLEESEYREIQRLARSRRISVAKWLREALDRPRQSEPSDHVARKLAAIRTAAAHNLPTADIDTMLEQIEDGYR